MKVELDKVECASAFDLQARGSVQLGLKDASGTNLRLTELHDVLFLPDVMESGQSISVVGGQFVPVEAVLDPFSVEFLRMSRQRVPEIGAKYADDFQVDAVAKTVCILGNLFSRNFGHWTEEMLKVAVLESSDWDGDYVIPALPPFAREFLQLLGIADERVLSIHRPTMFSRAVYTTAVHHENIIHYPEALEALRTRVFERLGGEPSHWGEKLWLDRSVGLRNTGIVRNREEVHASLMRHGFDVLDPATLSVADQLRAMHGAKVLGGPHGAQFVHVQFMPVSSTVIECFSPVYVNASVIQICRVLKHRYHQIVSRCNMVMPYQWGRDCEVDIDHLELVLESLERDERTAS